MGSQAPTIKVAVTQAEPAWFDLDGTVAKTCKLIKEAASNGAKLVTFPEVWLPGYPAWIWARPVDFALSTEYTKNSLKIDSPQMQMIRDCAAENNIAVCLGFSENADNSLYISQAIIGADGSIKMARRKLKPTHMERTVFGDATGDSLNNVVDVEGLGKVGALACWEHLQPLLKYHTCLLKEEIHVGAWPPVIPYVAGQGLWSMSREGCRNLSRTFAIESQTFVLHTTAIIGPAAIEKMGTQGTMFGVHGGGSSAIFGPDGRQLSEDLEQTEEGILYAELDFDEVLRSKSFVDVVGHYSRPDLLWLGVDDRQKLPVRPQQDGEVGKKA
ncbi:carbon-nitrogen hydrolase [Leptodontidium sp. MPI-SDFR-AT-0119]|nr:carbon-nitrogen hydrolase [Leptodontidium sp. MPI-SDFR-AT-0119]